MMLKVMPFIMRILVVMVAVALLPWIEAFLRKFISIRWLAVVLTYVIAIGLGVGLAYIGKQIIAL